MITSKDIFAKRKAGQIDEAYQMALQRMSVPNKDEWDDRAFGWCLIDLIKRDAKAGEQTNLSHYRQQLEAIAVPENDDVLTKQRQLAISLCNPEGQLVNEARQLSKAGQHDNAIALYQKLLQDNPGDPELSISFGWELYRLSKPLLSKGDNNLVKIKKNLNQYMKLNVEKPSLLHAVMLQVAAKLASDDRFNMAAFCQLWNLEFLRPEDWERFKTDDGKELPALAERVIQQASKDAAKGNDQNSLVYILPYLGKAISTYPDNIWLVLNKAKVLLELDRSDDALAFSIEVTRAKSNEYWAWELLGNITAKKGDEVSLSCYCKALLCSPDDRYSSKIRLKVATLMIERGQFPEAKYEIKRTLEAKQKEGTKIPAEIEDYITEDWYLDASILASNDEFYRSQKGSAEDLLFSQLPWITANLGEMFTIPGKESKPKRKLYLKTASDPIEVVIPESKFNIQNSLAGSAIRVKGEWDAQNRFQIHLISSRNSEVKWDVFFERIGVVDNVNQQKKLIHFLVETKIDGTIPFSNLNEEYKVGDSILVRLSKYTTKDGTRYRVLSAKKSCSVASQSLRKEFQELVRINDTGLGFTSSEIFIPPDLVKIHNLKDEGLVEGVALLTFNKKRSEWGWKAVSINNFN
ncbi:tetratricopeptide repeat protein [Vreelandella neptunia]|uniref:Tetratricopeptide repeat protein n=1 Tax=Vreelandella neptunia TaxID=115551 RepID=A0ABZ0YKF9_9GAMM|nr:hypothetical protein [Halomonas neptunia]MDN3562405.1 hypothetical protein [Halomonas neptunia]WQH11765.1 hypothetical protein SR894_16615 [Halomonas neptunia]